MNQRRYRAPAEDGAVLADPPLAKAGAIMAANRELLHNASVSIDGIPLAEFRRRARVEALAAAIAYLKNEWQGPRTAAGGDIPLLVSGHQPELFHPGVWVKNFALSGLGRQCGFVPLNLIVDNDAVKTCNLRLPVLNAGPVHLQSLPFDYYAGECPWEEYRVRAPDVFGSFAERAAQITRVWPFVPMLAEAWSEVLRLHDRGLPPGECFAAVRRAHERRWDCHNLELPMSRLCETPTFMAFVRHMLGQLPAFSTAYNQSLREYRTRHAIRSNQRPMPELARHGDEFEFPAWIWRAGETRRQRLFVRRGQELPTGVKVRPRALLTTLFARVCLADGFIHGIGGGKYDEVCDGIIERWLGIPPPRYFVLSATLRLPLPHSTVTIADVRQAEVCLRDAHWNPQRHMSPDVADRPEVCRLMIRKQELIRAKPMGKVGCRAWFRSLHAITELLRQFDVDEIKRVESEKDRCRAEWHANQRLRRRDFAWCLFPEEMLRTYFQRFL